MGDFTAETTVDEDLTVTLTDASPQTVALSVVTKNDQEEGGPTPTAALDDHTVTVGFTLTAGAGNKTIKGAPLSTELTGVKATFTGTDLTTNVELDATGMDSGENDPSFEYPTDSVTYAITFDTNGQTALETAIGKGGVAVSLSGLALAGGYSGDPKVENVKVTGGTAEEPDPDTPPTPGELELTLSETSLPDMKYRDKVTLNLTAAPADKVDNSITFKWTPDANNTVVKVEPARDGKSAEIEAIGVGSATVSVTAEKNGVPVSKAAATCAVTVNKATATVSNATIATAGNKTEIENGKALELTLPEDKASLQTALNTAEVRWTATDNDGYVTFNPTSTGPKVTLTGSNVSDSATFTISATATLDDGSTVTAVSATSDPLKVVPAGGGSGGDTYAGTISAPDPPALTLKMISGQQTGSSDTVTFTIEVKKNGAGKVALDSGKISWSTSDYYQVGKDASSDLANGKLVLKVTAKAVTATPADLGGYSDGGVVTDYAREALAWGVANGIITGTDDGRLNPEGTATRAHFAAFMYRFASLNLAAAPAGTVDET